MALRSKIHTVLGWANAHLSDNQHRLPFATRKQFREILQKVTDALSDIQTDNCAEYIIYTNVIATHKYKAYSHCETCEICAESRDHPSHE